MTPTPEQQVIRDAVRTTSDNILISACAGGTKTTMLELIAKDLGSGVSSIFLAFNTAIVDTARKRLPYYCRVATFHSFCNESLCKHLGTRPKVDAGKVRTQLKALVPNFSKRKEIQDDVLQLVSFAKAGGAASPEDVWAISSASDEVSDYAAEIIVAGQQPPFTTIDYDDMLWLTLLLGVKLPSPNVVLLDEAQDTNACQRGLLRRILGNGWTGNKCPTCKGFGLVDGRENEIACAACAGTGDEYKTPSRLIAVGDPHQSIYGFRGADSDAMPLLQKEFDMTQLPLSVSYRCAKNIVLEAQKYL